MRMSHTKIKIRRRPALNIDTDINTLTPNCIIRVKATLLFGTHTNVPPEYSESAHGRLQLESKGLFFKAAGKPTDNLALCMARIMYKLNSAHATQPKKEAAHTRANVQWLLVRFRRTSALEWFQVESHFRTAVCFRFPVCKYVRAANYFSFVERV